MIRHLSGIRTDCANSYDLQLYEKVKQALLILLNAYSRGFKRGEILEIQCAGISLAATFGCCQQRK